MEVCALMSAFLVERVVLPCVKYNI